MDLPPVRTHINLGTIRLATSVSGVDFHPYLWSVFFKVDGDTVFVDSSFTAQGQATVVGTPGDHDDLPGSDGIPGSFPAATITIPATLGEFHTVVTPIPVRPLGISLPGTVGCVAILMDQQDTPADAVAQGHQALNTSLQQALDALIPTFGPTKTAVTPADIQVIRNAVTTAVVNAVKNAQNVWQAIFDALLGTEDQPLAQAIYYYTQDQLINSAAQGIPLRTVVDIKGDRFKNDPSSFGTLYS